MPEYLAPGVYVEETSFRSKSIEGVSTSTTAFVGPTRKGPTDGPPELLTSFGDYERIYGGLDDLQLGGRTVTNYVAHAVRNYFNEGGSRLYVGRVYATPVSGARATIDLIPNADPTLRARLLARFPGDAGNGTSTLRALAAPASTTTLVSAPEGSLLRLGGGSAPGRAQVRGGSPTFVLPDGGVLGLTVGGTDVNVTFHGVSPEATGTGVIADPLTLDNTNNVPLQVVVDGVPQTIRFPNGNITLGQLIQAINVGLSGAYARADAAGHLIIGSDKRGSGGAIIVRAAPVFGFPADLSARGSDNPANNVSDRLHVDVGEINAALTAATAALPAAQKVQASLSADNHLLLSTVATGPAATLVVRDAGANSIHDALSLATGQPPATGSPGAATSYFTKSSGAWVDDSNHPLPPNTVPGPSGADLLTLSVTAQDRDGGAITYDDLGLSPSHPRWLGFVLAQQPSRRAEALENLLAMEVGSHVTAAALLNALIPSGDQRAISLAGGSDGNEPIQANYEAALAELEKLEDISIVAAPGSSVFADAQGIMGALISHAEKRRAYRIAVLDTPPHQSLSDVRSLRSRIDSTRAAVYYPWVVVSNPLARPGIESIPRELSLPPSGFVCGIYARTDIERGVWKAPANEVVRSALRFETDINFAQQEVLNPLGINCLRYLTGRGFRVWGARTATSDPEWKYVNVRRYFNYLESSIDHGTQWAVFEPNGDRLWGNIRNTISDFLYNEWVSGALLGTTPKEAFFVRCDRSTMTQNDLDNGRLVCLIGLAVLKPAEFVIFRIGQKTADERN